MASNPPIPIEKLKRGHQYRIEHHHGYWPPKTGIFSCIRSIDPKCAYFLHLAEPPRHHPKDRFFCTNEWTFHKSGKSIVLGKLSNSKYLPENVEREYLSRYGGSMRMKKTKRTRRTRRIRRTRRR